MIIFVDIFLEMNLLFPTKRGLLFTTTLFEKKSHIFTLKWQDSSPPLNTISSEIRHRLHSLKLTWHLKIGHPKRKLIFQPSIFRCENVSFRECITCFFLFVGRGNSDRSVPLTSWIFFWRAGGVPFQLGNGDPFCFWRICTVDVWRFWLFLFLKHVEVPNVETAVFVDSIVYSNWNVDGTVFYKLVYQDPLLTYLLASVPSIFTLRYLGIFKHPPSPDSFDSFTLWRWKYQTKMCSRRYFVV